MQASAEGYLNELWHLVLDAHIVTPSARIFKRRRKLDNYTVKFCVFELVQNVLN